MLHFDMLEGSSNCMALSSYTRLGIRPSYRLHQTVTYQTGSLQESVNPTMHIWYCNNNTETSLLINEDLAHQCIRSKRYSPLLINIWTAVRIKALKRHTKLSPLPAGITNGTMNVLRKVACLVWVQKGKRMDERSENVEKIWSHRIWPVILLILRDTLQR